MASADSSFPAEGTCRNIRERDRDADMHGDHSTAANLCTVRSVREELPRWAEVASTRNSDWTSAASHDTPPMPSYSLRSLSFCLAILAVFAAHLHLASLSLLVSRGLSEFPLPDRAAGTLPPDQAVSATRTETPPTASRALRDHFLTEVDPPLRQKTSDSASDPTSAVAPSPAPLYRARKQNAGNPGGRYMVAFKRFPGPSQGRSAEESSGLLESLAQVVLLFFRAGEKYVVRTFVEVLKAPSPLPRNVTVLEDVLIAWHLLLQALGCLLCGGLADVKGRRWALSHSVRLLGVASFLFTLTALFTAHLSPQSTKDCSVHDSQGSTDAPQSGAGTLSRSYCPGVFDKLSNSHAAGSQSIEEGTSALPAWASLPGALPLTGKLNNFFPTMSSPSLWGLVVHVLTFCSVACYSLAAIGCGGVVVVAQCLCFEAAAPFPLKPTKDADLQRSLSKPAQAARNNDHSPGVRGNVAHAGSLMAHDIPPEQTATCAGTGFSNGRSRDNSAVSFFLAEVPGNSGAWNTRDLGLRSPLLLERQHSPTVPRAMRNVSAHVCVRIRSLSVAFSQCCNRTLSCATMERILFSARTLFAPIFFSSSPYIPVAYLVGAQSAAYLFLPVVFSIVLEKLPISIRFGPGDANKQFTPGALSPFALFCIAFSVPILPICLLLHILISRFLRENPYYLFQRKVLLQHLRILRDTYSTSRPLHRHVSMDIKPSLVRIPSVRPLANRTLARAVRRRRDTATISTPSALFFLPSQRRRTSAHLEARDNGPPRSLSLSSSLPIPQSPSVAYAVQGQQGAHSLPPSSRMAQLRRAISCSDGNNPASPSHRNPSRKSGLFHHNVNLAGVLERRRKTRPFAAYDDILLHRTDTAQGLRGEGICSPAARGSVGYRSKRLSSVQLVRTACAAASERVANTGVHDVKHAEVKSGAEGRVPGPSDEAAAAPRSTVIDAVRRALSVYRLYIQSAYSTSLRGVMLPAAFIGAALYLRGVFRFLLLDCVVVEDEVEKGPQTATLAARYTSSDTGANIPHNITTVQGAPSSEVLSFTGMSSSSSAYLSPSFLSSYFGIFEAAPYLRDVFAEMLLFQLLTPVLLVRLCTCLVPMLFLSMLPPKPMQMLGCIFCAFMSFGIAVTLEALAQNFPDIPPISSARTASLLYEMVFCCCCSIPAFTAVLLPLQGFHTGVRCAFAATALACTRVAAAVSLVGLSVLLSYVGSVPYEEDSGGASTGVLGKAAFASLGAPNNITSVGGTSRITAGKPTSSNDACSADAAITAVVTCVYYVIAAAFTLLYTTHIRLPQKPMQSKVTKFSQGTKLQMKEPRSRIQHFSLDGEQGVLLQYRHPSQSWTTQWTDNAREGTLLAVDNLLLRKLRPPLVVCDRAEAEDDDIESEAASES